MTEVLTNKRISLERCIYQVQDFYTQKSERPFDVDFLRQDAVSMNVLRACELCIDMANHLIKKKKLGCPTASKESFDLLLKAGVIDRGLYEKMANMITFRNLVVHDYKKVEFSILVDVIENHLDDLLQLSNQVMKADAKLPDYKHQNNP